MRSLVLALLWAILAAPSTSRAEALSPRPRPLDAGRKQALDAFIDQARTRLVVPGAAVAVVQGERVIYQRVLGVKEILGSAPVTADTLFMIGSVTKPITTLMQAAQVDAGRLRWETPVQALLPSFALADAALARQVLLWHMSCACTGMPRQDLENLFEFQNVTPEERLASMALMKPTTALGERFQYSNLMVAAGGYAAAHAEHPQRALNDAYAAVLQARVLGPIGMRASTIDFARALAADHALPHALDLDGNTRAVGIDAERNVLNIAPAGALWSSLRDLERYLSTELDGGVAPGGRRVVSEQNLLERRRQRIPNEGGGYGLGVDVGLIGGLPFAAHDGGSFGFGASTLLLPTQKIGIVVLTNVRNGGPEEQLPFNAAVKRKVLELLFDGAEPQAAADLERYARAREEGPRRARQQLRRPPDAEWVARLAGEYRNAGLGKVWVRATPGGGELDAGDWKSAFAQRREPDGTQKLILLDPPLAGGEIIAGGDAARPALVVEYEQRYVFERL